MNAEQVYYDAYMAALAGVSTLKKYTEYDVVNTARRAAIRTVEQFAKDGLVPETDTKELFQGFEKRKLA